MAEPIPFKEANCTFTAPAGQPEVLDLPVHRDDDRIVSCWKLTKPEIEEVARTGKVWLGVMGPGQPPVFITGFSPFSVEKRSA